ncbi:hypothetical protein [Sinomonas sp. RB5]
MGHSIPTIRKWASAALGAALLTTSIITGAGAANALPLRLPSAFSVVPGAVGGSGKIVIVSAIGYTATYANPSCASDSYAPWKTKPALSQVTIGSTVHTSPPMNTWATTTSQSKTTKMTTPCFTASGQRLSAPSWVTTYDMRTWSLDYTCQPAGTKVGIVLRYGGANFGPTEPVVVPDNGPLPASCGGGSDHCGCGGSGTGGTQHGQPPIGTSGSAARGGGSAVVTGATTVVTAAPARATGGGSMVAPGAPSVAPPAAPAPAVGRGLAVQTAVDAGADGPDQPALAPWSVITGLLGLAMAAVASRPFRRPRRRA